MAMDSRPEEEEYMCVIYREIAYDPLRILPTRYVVDREALETQLEIKPGVDPITRDELDMSNVSPNSGLREEIRRYLRRSSNEEARGCGWDVIPDYPRPLDVAFIRDTLNEVEEHFNINNISGEEIDWNWSEAWKKLNYLRLNIQLEEGNRDLFKSVDGSIHLLGQIVAACFHAGEEGGGVYDERVGKFYREALRTVNAVELSGEEACELARGRPSIVDFLWRMFLLEYQGYQPKILGLLATLFRSQLQCMGQKGYVVGSILSYVQRVERHEISITQLRNAADIANAYCDNDGERLEELVKADAVGGLVQIVAYLVPTFTTANASFDHDVVNDASEGLGAALLLLHRLCACHEAARASALCMGLLTHIKDMVRTLVSNTPALWEHLASTHWESALDIGKTVYTHCGHVNIMTPQDFTLFQNLVRCEAISNYSTRLRWTVEEIVELFEEMVMRPPPRRIQFTPQDLLPLPEHGF